MVEVLGQALAAHVSLSCCKQTELLRKLLSFQTLGLVQDLHTHFNIESRVYRQKTQPAAGQCNLYCLARH